MDREDLRQAFCQMFGVQTVYDFQVEVAYQLLVKRKSVVLQAPTGSGKTWTALFPFLYAWQHELPFPRKCLYAVPLLILTEQFQQTARQVTKEWTQTAPSIRIQTGEQQGDGTFESDLIFTTIDQVISSALSVPYSLSRRQANINAGAVFSSFLVCDELHLFPIDGQTAQGALATLLEILHEQGDFMPFLLMTATLSETMLQELNRMLPVELVVVSEQELPRIASQQKTRVYTPVCVPLTAQAILEKHQTRSIAICNQVPRAIALYDALCAAIDQGPLPPEWGLKYSRITVTLLHARFTKRHRAGKETIIRQQFKQQPPGSEAGKENLILVATQTIEVGLDITCERLHTELAPANAIIQRAGRCARYQGEVGEVFIYHAPDEPATFSLPYSHAACEATWTVLTEDRYRGQALTFFHEQEIVARVHNPTDARLFKKIFDHRHQRLIAMQAAMFRGEKEGRGRLIRTVDSRTILVHHDPTQIRLPYDWRGFSLYHGTLRGWIEQLKKAGIFASWMLQYPVEQENEPAEDPLKDIRQPIRYTWEKVEHVGHIDASPVFVVHPRMVSYDPNRGFQLLMAPIRGATLDLALLEQEPEAEPRSSWETRYALEDYAEHIDKMLRYYRSTSSLALQMTLVAQRLATSPRFALPVEQIERAVLLALALHDVGKLQVQWQEWSHAYQRAINEEQPEHRMIVHTHYTPQQEPLHAQAEESLRTIRRPPHAAEGAWASWPILIRALEHDTWLSQAVFTAIVRHHSSFAQSIEAYTLHEQAPVAIGAALELIALSRHLAAFTQMQHGPFKADGAMEKKVIDSGDSEQWLLYTLIVRTLRLCDGHALEGV